MTNLNDTGESIPAYHIDHTLYEGLSLIHI